MSVFTKIASDDGALTPSDKATMIALGSGTTAGVGATRAGNFFKGKADFWHTNHALQKMYSELLDENSPNYKSTMKHVESTGKKFKRNIRASRFFKGGVVPIAALSGMGVGLAANKYFNSKKDK